MSKSANLATTLVLLLGTMMAAVAPTGALARAQSNSDIQDLDTTGPTSGTTSQPLAHSE
jgi:hypothetical protein